MSVLAVSGELTVMVAVDRKAELLAAVARRKSVELDVSGVTELDTAGLQVLLLAHREALALGKTFTLVDPSSAVTEVLELCFLTPGLTPVAA
jgi:anti-sigma B factor antagonist